MVSDIQRITVFNKENVIQTVTDFYNKNKDIVMKINKKFCKIETKKKPLTKYNLFIIMSLREDHEIKNTINQRERIKMISTKWKQFKTDGIPDDWYENMLKLYVK